MGLTFPNGLPGIIQAYGSPLPYVEHKPVWEASILVTRMLPFALPYAYGPTTVRSIRAHKLVIDQFVEALTKCRERGVPAERLVYGGAYCWRAMRGGTKLSTHTWGIALDLDPGNNP